MLLVVLRRSPLSKLYGRPMVVVSKVSAEWMLTAWEPHSLVICVSLYVDNLCLYECDFSQWHAHPLIELDGCLQAVGIDQWREAIMQGSVLLIALSPQLI